MDPVCNIDSLPEDIFIEIFEYLSHNELGRISRVCKKWNAYAKNPALWVKVNAKFRWFNGSQNEIVSSFSKTLCPSVTYIKLVFDYCHWKRRLNFAELCVELKERCPHLNTLILHRALFTVSFSSVMSICSEFLPNLKALILPKSVFCNVSEKRNISDISRLEILDISECTNTGQSSVYSFPKMPCLKKLNVFGIFETDNIQLFFESNMNFLHELELLHLGNLSNCSRTFHLLQNYAINLKELFLCWTDLNDDDYSFNNSSYPLLQTVCLRRCTHLSYVGIMSFIQACVTLAVVYIDNDMAESFEKNPSLISNVSKLEIVKAIDNCHHANMQDYLLH